jgi:phosphate transport system protein
MERKTLDEKLALLRDKLLTMGERTEQALHSAVSALTTRDAVLAKKVLEGDEIIDQMELDIDRFCVEIIALQQPAAHDLRFVIAAAKMTPVIERIADHSGSIAEAVLTLASAPETPSTTELSFMAERAGEMLRKGLDAFNNEDSEISRQVIAMDKDIDDAYKKVFGQLLVTMIERPSVSTAAAHLIFVAKHLERIGDYVKDICELNVYLREAVFIKHSPKDGTL